MDKIWDVISNIITICSILISIYEIIKLVVNKFSLAYIPFFGKCFSWRQINNMVKKVCKKIKGSPDRFGSIVGIGRGGAIFSALMSYQLDAIPVFVFDRQYVRINGKKTAVSLIDNIEFKDDYKELLKKPVLLVSQRANPGDTISTYVEVLKDIGFEKIEVCAILVAERSNYTNIRYYYKKYNETSRTKIYPWLYKQPDIMLNDTYIKDK